MAHRRPWGTQARFGVALGAVLVLGVGSVAAVSLRGDDPPPAPGTSTPTAAGTLTPAPATSPVPSAPATSATGRASGRPSSSGPTTRSSVSPTRAPARSAGRTYPLHTGIVSTTFWVGEIFDATAEDGSQEISTYDGQWMAHYGGGDGVAAAGSCETERRTAKNGYFPTRVTPRQNPFYLDLPFDDVNDEAAFARRGSVIPWAKDRGYAGRANDRGFSYLKNHWVQISRAGRTCYGQIEDAGPGEYDDAEYVFGSGNRRPKSRDFNNAGMDVSPALNGCLNFGDLDGEDDLVDWRFVDDSDVPSGPWKKIVTTTPLDNS